ncbi:PGRP2 amidase, partial [Amia calva]|nr:PGRP2 amidase [Amia calva]
MAQALRAAAGHDHAFLHHLLGVPGHAERPTSAPGPLPPGHRHGSFVSGMFLHRVTGGGAEEGVVLTPDGTTVALAPLLLGIEAGLLEHMGSEGTPEPQSINKSFNHSQFPHLPRALYSVTLAQTLGLSFLGFHSSQLPRRLGPDGCWDNVMSPAVFLLSGAPSLATTALLNGGMDGLILGERLSRECPAIIPRCMWGAEPYRGTPTLLTLPLGFLYVHHTYEPSAPCLSFEHCARDMRGMQRFHQDDRGWDDIGYSFVVGSDGYVYEGRGWLWRGAHTKGHNSLGYGVSIIGDYSTALPSPHTLALLRDSLAQCAVRGGRLVDNYTIHGHRQVVDTSCPGDALYSEIRGWQHYQVRHRGGREVTMPRLPQSALLTPPPVFNSNRKLSRSRRQGDRQRRDLDTTCLKSASVSLKYSACLHWSYFIVYIFVAMIIRRIRRDQSVG